MLTMELSHSILLVRMWKAVIAFPSFFLEEFMMHLLTEAMPFSNINQRQVYIEKAIYILFIC